MLGLMLVMTVAGGGDCRCWTGVMDGNDTVNTTLYLCRGEEGAAKGWLNWVGEKSGRNLRAVKGTWKGSSIVLGDQRFMIEEPQPGWHFCLIEKYDLQLSQKTGKLGGSYLSKACNDKAKISFQKATMKKCVAAEGPDVVAWLSAPHE